MNNKKKENKVSSNKTSKELKKQLKSLLLSKNFETSEGMGTGGSGIGNDGPISCSYNLHNCKIDPIDKDEWTADGYIFSNATVWHNQVTYESTLFSIRISGKNSTTTMENGHILSISKNTIELNTYGYIESNKKVTAIQYAVPFIVYRTETDSTGRIISSDQTTTSKKVTMTCTVEYNEFDHTFKILDDTADDSPQISTTVI